MPAKLKSGVERVATYIENFDDMICGGFGRKSVVLLEGASGTGKTIFSLEYLYNGIVKEKEPAVYISFAESKEALYKHALSFGWDFEKEEKNDNFVFIRYAPHEVEQIIKEGGGTVRDTIESLGAKRLVIDSLTAYTLLFQDNIYKMNESVLGLFDMLRSWECTSLVISESSAFQKDSAFHRLEFLADGIILFYYIRKGYTRLRALEVLKMRDTNQSTRIFPFTITEKGITVSKKEFE